METHEVVHAALEWAKSNGYAQRAREEAGGPSIDDLARAQARIEELEKELAGLVVEQDNIHSENHELRRDLATAKDARIEAEKEANDLRAWRRGLVKPGTERPCFSDRVVAELNSGHVDAVWGSCFSNGDILRWFDPEDIFEAADQDAEKESK